MDDFARLTHSGILSVEGNHLSNVFHDHTAPLFESRRFTARFNLPEKPRIAHGSLRLSLSDYNTMEEINTAVSALRELAQEE